MPEQTILTVALAVPHPATGGTVAQPRGRLAFPQAGKLPPVPASSPGPAAAVLVQEGCLDPIAARFTAQMPACGERGWVA
ncbi:hypothetical protein [Streptomyces sp. NPDC088789]|uniref:hypothetical protein n=1 Tax=Streptomyces sp. NPDC088789 TaxID=3365899 RepID=UPI0037F4A58B